MAEGDIGHEQMTDQPLELEHVSGYTGHFGRTLHLHPVEENTYVTCLGANVVIGDVSDPHAQEFLKGHDEEVSAVEVSPSGGLVASGQRPSRRTAGRDSPVIVWDFDKRRAIFSLFGMVDGVRELCFTPDDRFLAAIGESQSLFVWDMQTGEQLHKAKLPGTAGMVEWGPVDLSQRRPRYTLSYTAAKSVWVCAVEHDLRQMRYTVQAAPMTLPSAGFSRVYEAAAISPCGTTLLAGTAAGELAIFSVPTKTYRASFPVASSGLRALALAPVDGVVEADGSGPCDLYVGGGDGSLRRLRGAGADWICAAEVPAGLKGAVVSISVAASREWLLVGTAEGRIYRVAVGVPVVDGAAAAGAGVMSAEQIEWSHTGQVLCCSYGTARGDRVATGAADGVVRVWDLSDYGEVLRASRAGRSAAAVVLEDLADGEGDVSEGFQVIAGWDDGSIRCYAPASVAAGEVAAVPRRRRIGGAARATNAPLEGDKDTATDLWEIRAHRGEVRCLAAKPRFLVSAGGDGRICLWSRPARELLLQLGEVQKPALSVLLDVASQSSVHVLTDDRRVTTYSLRDGRRSRSHQLPRSTAAAFTCMSQRLDSEQEVVTGAADGRVLFWDCDVADRPVAELRTPDTTKLCAMAVSPSGRMLATCDDEGILRIYDLQTLDLVGEVDGHSASATAVSWAPDERQLVTTGRDCCLTIYNFFGVTGEAQGVGRGAEAGEARQG